METLNDKHLNKNCELASCTGNLSNDEITKHNVSRSLGSNIKLTFNNKKLKNSLSCDKLLTLSKTSSGTIVIIVDDQLNEIIDKQNIYKDDDQSAYLKRSDNINVQKKENDGKIVLNKRISSESLILDVVPKLSLSRSKKQNVSTCKNIDMTQGEITKRLLEILRNNIREHEMLENLEGTLLTNSSGNIEDIQRPEKLLIENDTFRATASKKDCVNKSECKGVLSLSYIENSKTKSFSRYKYFKMKLKGPVSPYFNYSSVVLKSADEKNYELVFDKEFEIILKDAIKGLDGDGKDHFVDMYKGDYDQYVLDLERDEKTDGFSKDAILVKTPSGRILILSTEISKTDSYDNACRRKSIIKPNSLVNMLEELLPCKSRQSKKVSTNSSLPMTQNEKQSSSKNVGTASKLVACNLISKAQITSETRMDSNNVQEILQSATSTIVHKSDSGSIEIILQKNCQVDLFDNVKKYLKDNRKLSVPLTLKFGKSCIDFDSTMNRTPKAVSSELNECLSNEDVFVNSKIQNKKSFTKKLISQANIATCSCQAHSYHSNKCVCKYLQYNMDNWIEDPEKNYVQSTQSQSTLDKEWSDIVLTPEIIFNKHSSYSNEDCYKGEHVCPFHIKRKYGVANAQGISGVCSDYKNETINKTNECGKKIKICDTFGQDQNIGTYWDYIEYLPPQLPPFLRDYIYE